MPQEEPIHHTEEKPEFVSPEESRRRVLAAISYLGALFLVPLILYRHDEFVRFHVRQGIVMCVVEVLAGGLVWVPLIGWTAGLAVFVIVAAAFLRTMDGQKWEIPLVAGYAKKIKL